MKIALSYKLSSDVESLRRMNRVKPVNSDQRPDSKNSIDKAAAAASFSVDNSSSIAEDTFENSVHLDSNRKGELFTSPPPHICHSQR